jgi:hypothetical protein
MRADFSYGSFAPFSTNLQQQRPADHQRTSDFLRRYFLARHSRAGSPTPGRPDPDYPSWLAGRSLAHRRPRHLNLGRRKCDLRQITR